MDDPEIEPLIFTREIEDKHLQLENLRMELWKWSTKSKSI